MRSEHPEEILIRAENEGSNEAVRLKNEIQMELMRRHADHYLPDMDQQMVWIKSYSKRFGYAFDRMIKSDPHFWLHDQESREATLAMFEREIYDEPGKIDPEIEAEKFGE